MSVPTHRRAVFVSWLPFFKFPFLVRLQMTDATPPATVPPNNIQDFSDGEIADGFGEGPAKVPMGLGGEEGKQAEPASTTLEADIVNGTTPGDEPPPDDTVSDSEPVPEPADEGGAEPQIPAEPEAPEFPPALLQMAGYATAEQAQRAGFNDPEALFSAVRLMNSRMLPPESPSTEGGLYGQSQQPPPPPEPQGGDSSGFKPFQPANADVLDEELLAAFRQQNEHFAGQFQQQEERFASEMKARDDRATAQEALNEEARFDEAIQALGWEDVFGKGDGETLHRASGRDPAAMTAFNHRLMMFNGVTTFRQNAAKMGQPPKPLEEVVDQVSMQLYPDNYLQQLRHKANGQVQSRRGVQASRPTARKTPLGTKNDRILSTLHGKHPKAGFDQNDDDFDGDI